MKFPGLTSLYGRIFAIFWFTLFVVVVTIVLLFQLDPRTGQAIPEPHLKRLEYTAENINQTLNTPRNETVKKLQLEQKIKRLTKRKNNHDIQIYFTTLDGDIISPQKHTKALRNFITIADDPSAPKQRLYGRWMMAGPFLINTPKGGIYMYSGQVWRGPSPFIIQILDKPFKLLLVTMLVSTPFLLWLAWAVTRPARRLQQAAERVAQGEFTADPNLETGPREFKKAGASFNQMVGALNTMISGQQRLLSDISHELRSPLTRLRMATALAQRKQGESRELTRVDTEAERLETMIGELLELSRMQVDSHQQNEMLYSQTLWYEMLEDARFEAEQCHKALRYNTLQDWPINGNPNLLISALENVIRNAIKYGNDVIEIQFTVQQHLLTITIDDNGDGVPEAELDDIFRPFYRVSTARDRDSGGTGLGLAITESAIRQHRGTIQANNSSLGGLNITITLPLAR
ncbi:envelope stress sensor histidine kinase CpxA [Photobacterium angustum]|uniref:envelope stress sensor histidine kinase CpxA n=1 Tax=Photobacterium angustum TaxID=661 RepID=UPI0005E29AFD|nr:envelope stress sensor histidine kinase CpxA [Photobacterium angustum]KJG17125.1 two-component sensor protein [Photobacterium angustum]KJG23405.1 two-component sensor protein [Photobacterium angustum]KJG30445.1 two-component sensor protein [Photobacterium angustum]PSW94482.1 two-component system sensor histidine kinase CpxA [Photobacterium angustum]PSX03223.1 two-component system sensor histidine kinase CpxA [Photobacterium angustum]